MDRNQKFENVLNYDFYEDVKRSGFAPLEYVKRCIEINEYYFFTADSDEEVEQLNKDFVEYVEDSYPEIQGAIFVKEYETENDWQLDSDECAEFVDECVQDFKSTFGITDETQEINALWLDPRGTTAVLRVYIPEKEYDLYYYYGSNYIPPQSGSPFSDENFKRYLTLEGTYSAEDAKTIIDKNDDEDKIYVICNAGTYDEVQYENL